MWVIGDIHGELDALKRLLALLPDEPLVFVGDFIDRGPDSKGVVQHVIDLGDRAHSIMGNHEAMMIDALRPSNVAWNSSYSSTFETSLETWIRNGGGPTIRSYRLEDGQTLYPIEHIDFIKNLPKYLEFEDFVVVHAGVDITVEDHTDMTAQVGRVSNGWYPTEHLLWIRNEWFYRENKWNGKRIIYGHTPIPTILNIGHGTHWEGRSPVPAFGKRSVGIDLGVCYNGILGAIRPSDNRVVYVNVNDPEFVSDITYPLDAYNLP